MRKASASIEFACLRCFVFFAFVLSCNVTFGGVDTVKTVMSDAVRSQHMKDSVMYRIIESGEYSNASPMTVSTVCDGAEVACSNNVYTYPAGTGMGAPPVNGYPNYGCIGGFLPGPAWFYMQVSVAGDIIIFIQDTHDVDFVCWGPFENLTDGCSAGLTGGNIVDCSFSPSATETCHILNAQVGEIYILLITNFSRLPGTITFQQTGGTGQTNCNIVVNCSMIAMTTNVTSCNAASNTYSVSGNVEFSNPPPTGILMVTDMTAVPSVSQTLFPPFVSPLPYSISNIPCDGVSHTLSAVFSDSSLCSLTTQYAAPGAICPHAQISGGGTICNDGISTANITVSFSGIGPFDFTWSVDGIPQIPVTGYNGPFPYTFATNVPGIYQLVSLSNAACPGPGLISGSATVIVNPLPMPTITGNNTVCSGSSGTYVTEAGMSAYQWTVSPGGTITAGGGPNDYTVTVTWSSPGNQTVSVNYTNGQGCQANTSTVLNVNVKPLPAVTNAGNLSICSGTTITIVPVADLPGTTFSWTASGSSLYVSGFSSGSGSGINDHLVNTGFNIETVTYSVVPALNGCSGNAGIFVVTVSPVADVYFTPPSLTICSGQTTAIQVLSHATGSSFSWTATGSAPTMSGFSSGSGNMISQQLNNTAYIPETVTYTVTPVINQCTGLAAVILVSVKPSPLVILASCWDPKTITAAKPFRLKGGIPLGGIYSGTGVNGGIFTASAAGPGIKTITYSFTNTFGCTGSANQQITVLAGSAFTCGDTMTDVRDNHPYVTVKIGSQCWLAADLNYGTEISSILDQRDNCLPEKYHNPASSIEHPASVYQWDEIMNYGISVADQGLCPPGWHVPSEPEWNQLFDNYIDNGFAASPLKYTGFSGFNALLYGVRHLSEKWDYPGFATFYWSSTMSGTEKSWAHGMNDPDPSVSIYPAFRSNAFSVRCLKD
jgi:uncharacterized protein (TIGR02145 family)